MQQSSSRDSGCKISAGSGNGNCMASGDSDCKVKIHGGRGDSSSNNIAASSDNDCRNEQIFFKKQQSAGVVETVLALVMAIARQVVT